LIDRINGYLGMQLSYGMAHCPSDNLDPGELLELAQRRLPSLEKPVKKESHESP